MSLDALAQLRLGSLSLDVSLAIAPGEVVALLGPNGAGKSTFLRCVAGLQPLDSGHIALDGVTLDDPCNAIFASPERRPVGMVFQDYLLFPHLSVLENVAFGPRARGVARGEARRGALALLEQTGLGELSRQRPGQLSGGQQQRVALARALAIQPRLLLLDEPLAALDASTRNELRRDLRGLLGVGGAMALVVTHDPVDAHVLADRVVVIENGKVVQFGTLSQVTAHPRSPYVAELVGVNLLSGTVAAGVFQSLSGGRLVSATIATWAGPALAAVRPQAIALHRSEPEGSPRNCWRATVVEIDLYAARVRVRLGEPLTLTAEITPGALADLGLVPGDEIWASVKATEVATYPN